MGRVLGETELIIFLPLGEMCGFTAGFTVGLTLLVLRAVQVCTLTPGNWMLEHSLEITLPNSAILLLLVAERLSDLLKDPRTKGQSLGWGPVAPVFWTRAHFSALEGVH